MTYNEPKEMKKTIFLVLFLFLIVNKTFSVNNTFEYKLNAVFGLNEENYCGKYTFISSKDTIIFTFEDRGITFIKINNLKLTPKTLKYNYRGIFGGTLLSVSI